MSAAPDPSRRYTYADYLTWPEGERWELIDGVPYLMSPAPGVSHQAIVFQMAGQLQNGLANHHCKGFLSPIDVRLSVEEEAADGVESVVQPDLLVVCDRRKIDKRGIRGAPDFVIEVISPGSAIRDEIEKVALYEKHGVREYWVIHPDDRLITIRRQDGPGHFQPPRFMEAKGAIPVAVLDGFSFDMDQVYAQVGDLLLET